MNILTRLTTAITVCLAMTVLSGCEPSEPAQEAAGESSTLVHTSSDKPGEITQMVTVTATIVDIDMETREVTITNLDGEKSSFIAGDEVQRLDEFKVGDKIKVEYFVSLASEIREPTEDEKQNPLTIVVGGGRATEDSTPAAGGLRQFKAVVTIVGIDRATDMVSLRGPQGNILIIKATHPSRLEKVNVGDTVIVTYTEAMAVSLEKVD